MLVPVVQARGGREARGAPDGGYHAGGPGICAAPADVQLAGGFGKPGVLLLPPQHGGHQQTEDAGLLHLPAGVLAEGDGPSAGARAAGGMSGTGDGRQGVHAAALFVGERPEPGGEDALRGPDGAARRVWPAA